ncbi:MAG: hypothetical protein ACRDZ8_03140 [Acidimicrobiales bacterium]
MTADTDLRDQLREKTGQAVSLCALYRTFDSLRAPLDRAILAAVATRWWTRKTGRTPHTVVLGLSEDHLYLFGAVSRPSGWRLGAEVGRAPRQAGVSSPLPGQPYGLTLGLADLDSVITLYPRYDTADAREIRRILC